MIRFALRLQLGFALGTLPAMITSIYFLWRSEVPLKISLTALLVIFGSWFWIMSWIKKQAIGPLHLSHNLLSALRQGDYSLRAHQVSNNDELADLMTEINNFAEMLRTERIASREASELLKQILQTIEVVVLTFDETDRLVLMNPAAEKMLGLTLERAMGKTALDLGLSQLLADPSDEPFVRQSAGQEIRYQRRTQTFRSKGRVHRLVVLHDVGRILRQEEKAAQKNLVRVLSHELNNSLAPIRSLAETLQKIVAKSSDNELKEDLQPGLKIIENRSDNMVRFVQRFSQLSKLPEPHIEPINGQELLERIAALTWSVPVVVNPIQEQKSPTLSADPILLEQALINLVKNAVEASEKTKSPVTIHLETSPLYCEIHIVDEGEGIAPTANLFVPFFSTKSGGSGIGLVLAREIVESHGGSLTLGNRTDSKGAEAIIKLPVY